MLSNTSLNNGELNTYSLIRNANRAILITLTQLGQENIFALLKEKAKQGVEIELLLYSQANENLTDEDILDFQKAGGKFYWYDNQFDTQFTYNNYAIVDFQRVLVSTKIWQNTALFAKEHSFIIDDLERVNDFRNSFTEIKKIASIAQVEETDIRNLIMQTLKKITKTRSSNHELPGITSGFESIDKVLGGWRKADLNVIATHSGAVGSDFLLSSIQYKSIDAAIPVVFFSLSYSKNFVVNHLLSAVTEIEADKISRGVLANYEWEIIKQKANLISEAPIKIYDDLNLDKTQIRRQLLNLKSSSILKIAIFDGFLGKPSDFSESKEDISSLKANIKFLKNLARELGIPIVASYKINRNNKHTTDLLKQMSNLDEIDNLLWLHHSSITKQEEYPLLSAEYGYQVSLLKNKEGKSAEIPLYYLDYCAKFVDSKVESRDLEQNVSENIASKKGIFSINKIAS